MRVLVYDSGQMATRTRTTTTTTEGEQESHKGRAGEDAGTHDHRKREDSGKAENLHI